jgi:K+-transporting ATPase ATPase C chain
MVQVPRVAKARNIPVEKVSALVQHHVEKPWLGIFGVEKINVLKLNLELNKFK